MNSKDWQENLCQQWTRSWKLISGNPVDIEYILYILFMLFCHKINLFLSHTCHSEFQTPLSKVSVDPFCKINVYFMFCTYPELISCLLELQRHRIPRTWSEWSAAMRTWIFTLWASREKLGPYAILTSPEVWLTWNAH